MTKYQITINWYGQTIVLYRYAKSVKGARELAITEMVKRTKITRTQVNYHLSSGDKIKIIET